MRMELVFCEVYSCRERRRIEYLGVVVKDASVRVEQILVFIIIVKVGEFFFCFVLFQWIEDIGQWLVIYFIL